MAEGQQNVEENKQGWLKAFQSPAMQTALLQFGIAALQPQQPGVGGVSQFANAVGSAGEAVGRQQMNVQQQQALAVEQQQRERQLDTQDRATDIAADRNAVAREQIGSAERQAELERQTRMELDALGRATQIDIAKLNRDTQYAIAHMGDVGADRRLNTQLAHAERLARMQMEAQGEDFHPTVFNALVQQEADAAMLADGEFDLARAISNYKTSMAAIKGQPGSPLPPLGSFGREQFAALYKDPANRAELARFYPQSTIDALASHYGIKEEPPLPEQMTASPASPPASTAPRQIIPDTSERDEQFRAAVDAGVDRITGALSGIFSGGDNLPLLSSSEWQEKVSQAEAVVRAMPEGSAKQRAAAWINRLDQVPLEDRAIAIKRIETLIESANQ